MGVAELMLPLEGRDEFLLRSGLDREMDSGWKLDEFWLGEKDRLPGVEF